MTAGANQTGRDSSSGTTTPAAGLLLAVAAMLVVFNPLRYFDNALLDSQFRLLRALRPERVVNDVVIVGIDEETLSVYREPLALWHQHFADFFQAMAAAGPAVVGVDMVLPDRSYDFMVDGIDARLLRGLLALNATVPVVIGQAVNQDGSLQRVFPPITGLLGKDRIGLVLLPTDEDGLVRRTAPSVRFGNVEIPSLTTQMARLLNRQPAAGFIDYSRGDRFVYIPMQEVVNWAANNDVARLRRTFAGRTVLLGGVLPFADRHPAPVALASWEPGVRRVPGSLIHAQILRSYEARSVLRRVPAVLSVLIILAACLFYLAGSRLRLAFSLLVLLVPGLVAASLACTMNGWILPVSNPLVMALLAAGSRFAIESRRAMQQRRRLQASFSGYVSPNVLTDILGGAISPDMEGRRYQLCVLFSDIRNFTTRSESRPPEEIISLLNQYFDQMTAVIHEHGGTVDKFIGDGLMAFFGAPNRLDNPSRHAFDAARGMLGRLEELNLRLQAQGFEAIEIGIGLHYGDVVVGHVGSRSRHEYTVIGDTVNLASRLEGRTKELGFPLVCSRSVVDQLGSAAAFTALGETPIKGRTATEVFGWRPPGMASRT